MRPYSVDLCQRVMTDCDAVLSTQAIAEKYRISTKCVRDLRRLREETGAIAPRPGKPGPKPRLADHAEQLTALVLRQPDATLQELQRQLPVAVGLTTIFFGGRSGR